MHFKRLPTLTTSIRMNKSLKVCFGCSGATDVAVLVYSRLLFEFFEYHCRANFFDAFYGADFFG